MLSLLSLYHNCFRKLRCYNLTRKYLLLFLPSNECQPVFWWVLVKVTLTPHLQSGESQGYFYKITEEGPFPLNLVACKQVPWRSSFAVTDSAFCSDSHTQSVALKPRPPKGLTTSETYFSPDWLADGLPRWLSGKDSACQGRSRRKHGFYPWVRTIP